MLHTAWLQLPLKLFLSSTACLEAVGHGLLVSQAATTIHFPLLIAPLLTRETQQPPTLLLACHPWLADPLAPMQSQAPCFARAALLVARERPSTVCEVFCLHM